MKLENYNESGDKETKAIVMESILNPYIKILRNLFWQNFEEIKNGSSLSQKEIVQNISKILEDENLKEYINKTFIKQFVKSKEKASAQIKTNRNTDEEILDALVYDSILYRSFNKLFTEKLKNQIFYQNKLEPKKPAAKEYPKLNKDEANNIINFFINIESEFRKIIKQKIKEQIRSKEITYKYHPAGWERKIDTK